MHGIDANERHFRCANHLAEVCLVVEFAIILRIIFRCFTEIHDHGRRAELLTLAQGEVTALPFAEPVVIVDGPFEISETSQSLNKAIGTFIEFMVFLGLRIVYLGQTVRLRQNDDLSEFGIDGESTIRQENGAGIRCIDRFLMWQYVIDLLIHDRFTLSRITHAHARNATERMVVGISPRFRLRTSRIDTAHHLAADHTDLVQNEELRAAEMLLECMIFLGPTYH